MKKIILLLSLLFISFKADAFTLQLASTGYACLESNNATTNFSKLTTCGVSSVQTAFLLNFPIQNVVGTITAATLNVYESNRSSNHNLNIARILQPWVFSEATWNIYSTGNNWNTAGALGSGTDYTSTNEVSGIGNANVGWLTHDVTGMVEDMQTNGTNTLSIFPATASYGDTFYTAYNTFNVPYLTITVSTQGFSNENYIYNAKLNNGRLN